MPAITDGILENFTVVVSLDIHEDVVPACQKAENRSVLVFVHVPVAIAQILPTRIQTRTISQMMMAYYSPELDGDDTGFDGIFEEQ
jgi:hypothetical protein